MPTDFPDYAQASNPPFPITSISNASGPVTDQNVPLPAGCRCISVGTPQPLGLPSLDIVGHITGEIYTEALLEGIFLNYPLQWMLIDPADTSIDVSVGASPSATFYLGGSFSPVAVALNINEDVLAQLVDSSGTNLGSFTYPPGGLDDSQKILATGLPQPLAWMAPSTIKTVQGVGASTAALVAGVAGETIRLWNLYIDITTAGTAGTSIQDTSSNVVARLDGGLAAHAQLSIPFSGAPLTGGAGAGLNWAGVSGSASANVTVVYSQE